MDTFTEGLKTNPVNAFLISLVVVFLTPILWTIVHQYVKVLRARGIPPGPAPLPVLGNLGEILSSPKRFDEWCLQKAKAYGGMFSFWMGDQLFVYVSSYEAVKEVLVTKDKEFASRPLMPERVALTLGPKSIFMSSYGEYWRQARKLSVLHLLSNKAVKTNASVRDEELNTLIGHLKEECKREGGIVEPREHIIRTNLNTMMLPLFGIRFPAPTEPGFNERREALYASIQESFRQMGDFDWGTVLPALAPVVNRDVRKTTAFRDRELELLIEEHRAAKEKAGASFVARDMVDVLLTIPETEDLTLKNLIYMLLDLLNAAVDTSGVSIEWTLAELTRRPEIRKRLQAELDSVIGRERPVQEGDIENLPYLRAVIKEHFRYRGVGPFPGPHLNEVETTVQGYRIPAKTQVMVHTRGLSRDPSVFSRADEFLPDRFLAEDVDITGKDLRVLPFGAGRRGCPGIVQGLAVVHLAVARIVQAFDFELIDGKDIDMEERNWGLQVSLRTPLKARFTPR
ncbi:Cytochrome P450 [Klebsormidium nitens]|uniref:Cytochrome P450 n=1 Tax=Klebsormidium nitens TaxID=105231 RepID=A0A1Y1HMF1_KLENI|nr:Cytochrome P450 [Klebsormidium nitens]|eukprot:GAQ79790.1 Cytochrome P450 [Klebsormidium nitens]